MHETVRSESGMRYHLTTTASCGRLLLTPLHLVAFTGSLIREPLCSTTRWDASPDLPRQTTKVVQRGHRRDVGGEVISGDPPRSG
jgi:hypothetical protein